MTVPRIVEGLRAKRALLEKSSFVRKKSVLC